MKLNRKQLACFAIGLAFICTGVASGALPLEWQHAQQFAVAAPGLLKLSLPLETLDAARPALEDLRLHDDAGNEVPFFVERPVPANRIVQNPKSFQVSLNSTTTVITLESGVTQPLDGVTLETPASNFIKAVGVEGSADGRNWQPLAQGQPIFRQPSGAGQLHISFAAGAWRWLRLTVSDQRSEPIPFTGALIHAAAPEAPLRESQLGNIVERNENPGQTRLTVNLGAANLDVASVSIETDEPLFMRVVTIAVPQVSEDSIREQTVGQGVIYRVAVEGQPTTANLSIPLESRIHSRELVLLIRNEDSPPLPITAVRIERRPVYLVFNARRAGIFHILTGNKFCAPPRYDMAALGGNLKNAAIVPVTVSALVDNPDFRAPEALPGLDLKGASLDVAGWKFRKSIPVKQGGSQQLELDLDVLAHAQSGFADLRILRGSNQVPYIVQRTSIERALALVVSATNDVKNPKLSRWIIKLPRSGLPLTRLTCLAETPLFQRTMSLSEELTDERGEKYSRGLGNAAWTQMPGRKTKEFSLATDGVAQSDTLFLETENGDNTPLQLGHFTASYSASRVLFKAKADDRLFLYYGNPGVLAPSYDLTLVAGELLAADKTPSTLTAEEPLTPQVQQTLAPGTGGIVFWVILAVVVIGLLVVISRLLPKTTPPV